MRSARSPRHFPTFARLAVLLWRTIPALAARYFREALLAAPFVALFIVVCRASPVGSFFWLSGLVGSCILLPLAYLVSLLMLRRHWGQRS